MSKILIIGNVLKDVYLKLDERNNDFEKDENNISWLELGFNGAAHQFFRRTSVYGGAAVSLSVLSHLGIDAKILGSKTEVQNGDILWQAEPDNYRYILCHEGEITYFVPSSRKQTDWTTPAGTPEWILVDRSTFVSAKLVDEIKNFLKFSPTTKLAVHVKKNLSPSGRRLADMADVLFVEDEPPIHKAEKIVDKIEIEKPNTQLVCHISPRRISMGEEEESWHLSRTDMLTHLTVYSTIVATVLGVISVGGSAADAILWARINAEQATLESSLSARKLKQLAEAELEKRASLKLIAKSLVAPKRGVLAADESEHSLTKRLVDFGISASARTRQAYRDLLLTTPELSNYLSGVILPEELIDHKTSQNQNYIELLTNRGIIPGIKADQGQAKYADTNETYTLGAQDLAVRLDDYYNTGFRFAKWHAKFYIGPDTPSFVVIEKNAELLANFAKECQLAGLVPMLESDIEYDGDYTIDKCVEVSHRILTTIFDKLAQRHVDLSGCLLKTSMISAGKQSIAQSTPSEVAIATAAVLTHSVPRHLAGVLLLSGGQEPKTATKNLEAICKNGPYPWLVTFAFSRALQDPLMKTWKGNPDNIKSAQAALRRYLQDDTAALA